MTTTARIKTEASSHWYLPNGTPFYETAYADPSKGMRKTTLKDARKVNALPSTTTIMRVLAKPELQSWLIEQAVLAVLTSPRQRGEADDAFVHRVLHVEKVQDQERDTAADLGTRIHDACARWFTGQDIDEEMRPWIANAVESISSRGEYVAAERVLVGSGYAGMADLIIKTGEHQFQILDWKSSKNVPEKAWKDHVIQLSSYAAALQKSFSMAGETCTITTANVYISTNPAEKGKCHICEHDPDWTSVYNNAFLPAFKIWCWQNNYYPAGK